MMFLQKLVGISLDLFLRFWGLDLKISGNPEGETEGDTRGPGLDRTEIFDPKELCRWAPVCGRVRGAGFGVMITGG